MVPEVQAELARPDVYVSFVLMEIYLDGSVSRLLSCRIAAEALPRPCAPQSDFVLRDVALCIVLTFPKLHKLGFSHQIKHAVATIPHVTLNGRGRCSGGSTVQTLMPYPYRSGQVAEERS